MTKRMGFILAILVCFLIAGTYRIYAANRLNVDIDELTYLQAGQTYANYLGTGQLAGLSTGRVSYEHPVLYKVLYGVALLTQPARKPIGPTELPPASSVSRSSVAKWVMADRYVSVSFGTLAVMTLAVVDPFAGLFLGLQTLSVKYTSEIYLEALPLLTSLLCALAYLRWVALLQQAPPTSRRPLPWLLLSALFMGLTAASKYVYCVVGLGIVLHFLISLFRKQISWRAGGWLLAWGLLSILVFFAFDPYLWVDPLRRILATTSYHFRLQGKVYKESLTSKKPAFPFWQPLRWLFSPARYYDLGPNTVFKVNIDILICFLAVIGLPRFIQKRLLFFCWFLAGLVFLLLWSAKWPQYILIILAPFSLAASEGVLTLWYLAKAFLSRRQAVNAQDTEAAS